PIIQQCALHAELVVGRYLVLVEAQRQRGSWIESTGTKTLRVGEVSDEIRSPLVVQCGLGLRFRERMRGLDRVHHVIEVSVDGVVAGADGCRPVLREIVSRLAE